jgi:hypothetical protein
MESLSFETRKKYHLKVTVDNVGKFKEYSNMLYSEREDSLLDVREKLGKLIIEQPWLLYEVPQEERELFVQKFSQNKGFDSELASKVQVTTNIVFSASKEVALINKAQALVSEVFHSTLSSNELEEAYRDPFSFLNNKFFCCKAGEKIVIEIAKIAAAQSGYKLSENIKEYGIRNPDALVEIAKIVAAQSGSGISEYIQRYRIKNQDALIEIAKIAAARDGSGVSEYIQRYGIKNPDALIEIAKIAAARDGSGVSKYIQRYGIKNPDALIEIAKIAAEESGEGVSEYIQEYGIRNPDALIEIAKIAAAQDGSGVSEYIQEYRIRNSDALIEIAKISISSAYEGSFKYVLIYLDKFISLTDVSVKKEREILILMGLFAAVAQEGVAAINELRQIPHVASYLPIEQEVSEQTKSIIGKYAQHNADSILPSDIWENQENKALFLDKVGQYRNQAIAGSLIIALVKHADSTDYKLTYDAFVTGTEGWVVHKILPAIVPAAWMSQGEVDTEDAQKLLGFLDGNREEFRNNQSPLLQTFLLTVLELDKIKGLTPARKLQLLAHVCGALDCIKGLGLLRALCSRNLVEALEDLALQDPLQELQEAFKRDLLKDDFVDLSEIEDLAERYQDTFGKTRIPNLLEMYRISLRACEEEVRKTLERFERSVLLGTFEEERYKLDNNLHLQHIHQYDETMVDKWRNLTIEIPVLSQKSSHNEEKFSMEKFFQAKMQDQHWHVQGQDQFPRLTAFLNAPSAERDEMLNRLEVEIVEMQTSVKNAFIQEKKELGRQLKDLQMQKACMKLVQGGVSDDEQVEQLKDLFSQMKQTKLELVNDLQGLIRNIQSSAPEEREEKAMLCKGWEDLLGCGTEVAGSCQRVDGSAFLNKCLLGYCLDGKNAMVAVKDIEGKIQARCILKLLWNETEQKPVLFLERLYPDPCSIERQSAIRTVAMQCAKEMNCQLLEKGTDESQTIVSLGGPCPYEYEDGANGVMPNGKFVIRDTQEVSLEGNRG